MFVGSAVWQGLERGLSVPRTPAGLRDTSGGYVVTWGKAQLWARLSRDRDGCHGPCLLLKTAAT